MKNRIFAASILLAACLSNSAELDYPHELKIWKAVSATSAQLRSGTNAWFKPASYSNYEWRVYSKDGQIKAQLSKESTDAFRNKPPFKPTADRFRFENDTAFIAVEDGWLVGFNQGEFGAALYWFSHDGQQSYKVSDHQIVDFFLRPEGVYAVEGLAHLHQSRGSIVRVVRENSTHHWRATLVMALPLAPYTISNAKNGTAYIALSHSLVSVDSDLKEIRTVVPNAPWMRLYASSSVLASEEQKLYVGMRQFVAEVDLKTRGVHLLVPSSMFLRNTPYRVHE